MERKTRRISLKGEKPTKEQFIILSAIVECASHLRITQKLTHNQARQLMFNRAHYFNIPTKFLAAVAFSRGCDELMEEGPDEITPVIEKAKAQDPEGAVAGVVYLPEEVAPSVKDRANADVRYGLDLVKNHITDAQTQQNMDLHAAVQLIVLGCRRLGLLE